MTNLLSCQKTLTITMYSLRKSINVSSNISATSFASKNSGVWQHREMLSKHARWSLWAPLVAKVTAYHPLGVGIYRMPYGGYTQYTLHDVCCAQHEEILKGERSRRSVLVSGLQSKSRRLNIPFPTVSNMHPVVLDRRPIRCDRNSWAHLSVRLQASALNRNRNDR